MPSIAPTAGSYRALYNGTSNNLGSSTPVPNRLYLTPFILNYDTTVVAIGQVVPLEVTGSTGRVGIYASDANGFPTGNPLVESGVLSGSTTGWKETAVSITLTAGTQYWGAFVNQGVPGRWRSIPQTNLTAIGQAPLVVGPYTHYYWYNMTGALPTLSEGLLLISGLAFAAWIKT